MTRDVPRFCDAALADRIERAEASLMAKVAEAAGNRNGDGRALAIPVAGGIATYAEEGSPFNKVAGLGFDGVPDAAALDAIELAFHERGAPVQVELSNLADPALGPVLSERGYRLVSFENVLGAVPSTASAMAAPGVEVRISGDDEFDTWLAVVVEGVAHPDGQGLPSHEQFPRHIVENAERDLSAAGATRYLALRDGVAAGGAGLRIADRIAQLTGAATVPEHRRRGIQSALLSARCADASAAGSDIVVVTTQPGSKSQENVQRSGFDLLYTRAVLVN